MSTLDRYTPTLDRLDTEDFFLATYVASGPETVRSVLLASPEFELLRKDREAAAQAMLARLAEATGIRRPETRIAYFVFFEECGKRTGLAATLDWIESLPDDEAEQIRSPWHAWHYALGFLRAVAPPGRIPADSGEAFRQRRRLRTLVG